MHAYLRAVQLKDEVRVAVGDQRRLVEPGRGVDHSEDAHSFAKERSQAILEQRKLVTLALIGEHARVIEEASGGVAASHYREEGQQKMRSSTRRGALRKADSRLGHQATHGMSRLLTGSLFDALIRRAKRSAMVVC